MKKYKKSKKKKIILFSIVVILIILFVVLIFVNNYEKNKLEVILVDKLEAEINTDVKLLSFIKEVKNAKVITEDEFIDTSKLGKKKVTIDLEKDNKKEKFSFNVNIVDTTSPVIKSEKKITVNLNDKVDLLSYAQVEDNSLEDINVELQGSYDLQKVGSYDLKYYAKDASGNETTYDFILNVVDDPNNRTFTTSKGYVAKVVDGITYIDGVLVVNKTYSLPKDYGSGLTDETNNAFDRMKNDATKEGLTLYIASGFRSYSTQERIYNNYVSYDGKENADTYSARAGYSEHQTGLAFDLNSIDNSFADTKEGKWVKDNCYKYGLIIRYPKGKESITGYIYEPWHLRYVGVNLATKLYNNGDWITLEEYYGIDSKYKEG